MADSYPLRALLSVRRFREDAAQNAVRSAERKAREARQAVEKCRAELARYCDWRLEEAERRYDAVMGVDMTLDEVDAFRAGLAALADGELARETAVGAAEKEAAASELAVGKAREAAAQARREAAKIEAHREIWREEARKEAERLEDREMEEFHAPAGEADE